MVKKQYHRPKKRPSKAKAQEAAPPDPGQDQEQDHSQNQNQNLEAQAQQQRLLDIFAHAFRDVLASNDFAQRLRDVKHALFDRDFAAAFGSEDLLRVYAARWSPTRALCYASVLQGIGAHLEALQVPPLDAAEPSEPFEPCPDASPPVPLRMLAIGGCAAEHVAFAAYLRAAGARGALTLVDAAPWAPIASLLQERITSPPLLSRYASAAARAAAAPLLGGAQLSAVFARHDVLALGAGRLAELAAAGGRPLLVTLMFTLNELYTTQGIGKTTAFLGTLGDVVPAGSLLLVVDSPGSYSEAAVGREKKKYPMQWLLDHTLLHTERGSREAPRWRRLQSQDSVWFRLPDTLTYPVQLENMRYQMHLYRREETAGAQVSS
ncbi:Uncharacterized protein ESCO_006602 [Escovopsis weberi]|uniref:25S rRNA (Uridine(2843)-N(3))-methyltransferase n=1 Tax=Escovopsis weberi TaxID=150374 RepID=A0A0M8NAG2_ESCWE|nr:Uncharacterized protein ESCO_006602 [Escovopsis weberi]